jgi:hypothetical protein
MLDEFSPPVCPDREVTLAELIYEKRLRALLLKKQHEPIRVYTHNMAPIVLDQLPHTIHSLPYGVISTSRNPKPRCAVAIGDHAIDLYEYFRAVPPSHCPFDDSLEGIFAQVDELRIFEVAGTSS